jgi:hypothetical protein
MYNVDSYVATKYSKILRICKKEYWHYFMPKILDFLAHIESKLWFNHICMYSRRKSIYKYAPFPSLYSLTVTFSFI